MENDNSMLIGHIKDLASRAYQNDYTTHTNFLGLSELAAVLDEINKSGGSAANQVYNGVKFTLYGGYEDSERNVLCFLPSYLDAESLKLQEDEGGSIVSCLKVVPVNAKFADKLTHRDFLGSLMNLGIERDIIGDILVSEDGHVAYLFILKDMEELICKELIRIKHTCVKCIPVSNKECDIRPSFEEISGSVASERLDAVLALVYRISRSQAQELVSRQLVFIDGRCAFSAGYDLKEGSRVSVRGHGKFKYLGQTGSTRKGRLMIKVAVYK